MHHEIISVSATAPGASGAAGAALSGDSLTIRNAKQGTKIFLLSAWATFQTAGFLQLVGASWNDTTRGIRVRVPSGDTQELLGRVSPQPLIAQELLGVTIAGSATAGDVEEASLMVWYEDQPGIEGRYLDWDGVNSRGVRRVTVYNSVTTTAGPAYTGAQALNAGSDLLRPNTDYALIGGVVGARCLSLGIRSPDWGNVRVGIPGSILTPSITSSWFLDLSYDYGLPLVPVLNSGNKTGILIDAAQDENAAAVPFSLDLVELGGA